MKSKIIYYLVMIFIIMSSVACIIPIPVHKTGYDSLSKKEQALYNDAYEFESDLLEDTESFIKNQNIISEVVNLDWFGTVNNIFTKYTLVAQVIDVKTKKSYFVERVGGYNHADVQTIDKENTAIFKDIYNGIWSWVRRPVWVYIDGMYIAASINGMPHGFSLIDNGEGGHTCIHFLNSRTHGTNRVDESHQAAIAEAYARRNELYKLLA